VAAAAEVVEAVAVVEAATTDGRTMRSHHLSLSVAIAAGMLAASASAAFAQFSVCNRTSAAEIYVALGFHEDRGGWASQGWYTVPRGRCTTTAGQLTGRYYYLYAESNDVMWDGQGADGSSNFCVHSGNAFKLQVAKLAARGSDNPNCEKHGYVTKRFRRVDTQRFLKFVYTVED
jgi:uncharacterized membrane protein